MESSKRPSGVFKGRYVDNRPQRHILRLSDLKQALEDKDYEETSLRYPNRKQTFGADQGERPQSGRLGRRARNG